MTIKEYWTEFQKNTGSNKEYLEAFYFCDNKKDADELAALVLSGKKRATASNYILYEHDNETIPKPGELSIVTDFEGNPLCVIETTEVEIVAFKDVSPEFAAREGEGDASLSYWKDAHRRFFSRELKEIGATFNEDILVVCESFDVIYE
ncbi:MAG: ASCH domain-containing protein [Clostridia bacterium]|nr:ASCH domain-containing protein [Clostridia bacterium]